MSVKGIERKRVLGIVGSPRRGGNTEILVDEVLEGAKKAGARVEKVILSELSIAPCRGCDACADIRRCVQQDDFRGVLERMKKSQVWVLGTPVYWWGPSAQFKAFLDRWYSFGQSGEFEGRRAIIVAPMGDENAAVARHTVGMLADSLQYLQIELFTTVLAPGVVGVGAVRAQPDMLAAARRAGEGAVTGDRVQERDVESGDSPERRKPLDEATLHGVDPSQMVGPRLVVTGAPIPLPRQQQVLIGRVRPHVTPSPDIDLVPHGGEQAGVSRHHAKMWHDLDGWELEDMNSTNGTFVNDTQVLPGQRVRVHAGDVLRLGQLTFIFYE
jgi:multimeric flavodoxin WrbA